MRTLNLSGFTTGDNLSLSVSQNAITAGPVNIPAWGGVIPSSGITINVNRTSLMVAPDSVRFSVDLSQADFDTVGPVGDEIYDARMHDLIYLWDFDDAASGDWTAPVNVLAGWKNRNVAKGPWVAHMYTRHGTYNPSVLVIEPSSGKTATASISVTVANPDVVYAGTGTICVSASGDFADAPRGAVQITASSVTASTFSAYLDTDPKRVIFRRGEEFDAALNLTSVASDFEWQFGAYGIGNRPILNATNEVDGNVENGIFYMDQGYGIFANRPNDLRIADLELKGTYDATTDNWLDDLPSGTTCIRLHACNTDFIVSNVLINGIAKAQISITPDKATRANTHIDDTVIHDFGGSYQMFMGPSDNVNASFSMTGCRISQPDDALALTGDAGTDSPVRIVSVMKAHVRGCDVYHMHRDAMALRLVGTPEADGAIINVHSTATEGGAGSVLIFGNSIDSSKGIGRSSVGNTVVDGCIWVGSWCGQKFADIIGTGLTIRNCLAVMPAVQYVTGPVFRQFLTLRDSVVQEAYGPTVADAPIRVYNCTMVNLRNTKQNNSHVPIWINDNVDSGVGYSNYSEGNNVVHAPNEATPRVAFAPLVDSAAELWTPRNVGYRNPGTGVLDVTKATPVGSLQPFLPLPGSAALGAALTGDVSYMDITMRERPEPPSKGAWEAD